jgi:hypothetical protein
VPALSAADGLAALEGHVLVAVAALVVHRAGVDVDLLLGFCGAAVVAAVLLGGHSGERFMRVGARSRGWDERCAVGCVCGFVFLCSGGGRWKVFVALVEEINCEDKAEWRRGSGARALSIGDLRRLQEPFHMVIRSGQR